MSKSWLPIRYRRFYDVPRSIVVFWSDRWYLFESRFVDDLDDYSDYYTVYELPSFRAALADTPDWTGFSSMGEVIGRVPVSCAIFDATCRHFMGDWT